MKQVWVLWELEVKYIPYLRAFKGPLPNLKF